MLPTSAGVEPVTSWSPVGRRIQLSHRGWLPDHSGMGGGEDGEEGGGGDMVVGGGEEGEGGGGGDKEIQVLKKFEVKLYHKISKSVTLTSKL